MSLSLLASAQQSRLSLAPVQSTIRYAEAVPASSFDSPLPDISLAYFLSYETGTAEGMWSVVDCPKQTDSGLGKTMQSTCVQAEHDVYQANYFRKPARSLSSGGVLTVLISVQSRNDGGFRGEAILKLSLTDVSGAVHAIRNLIDLPMELHKSFPVLPPPRDLPVPAG